MAILSNDVSGSLAPVVVVVAPRQPRGGLDTMSTLGPLTAGGRGNHCLDSDSQY